MLVLRFKIAFGSDNSRLDQEVMGGLLTMSQPLPQHFKLFDIFLDFAIHEAAKISALGGYRCCS